MEWSQTSAFYLQQVDWCLITIPKHLLPVNKEKNQQFFLFFVKQSLEKYDIKMLSYGMALIIIIIIINYYLYSAKYICIWSNALYNKISKIKWYQNELQKAKNIQFD